MPSIGFLTMKKALKLEMGLLLPAIVVAEAATATLATAVAAGEVQISLEGFTVVHAGFAMTAFKDLHIRIGTEIAFVMSANAMGVRLKSPLAAAHVAGEAILIFSGHSAAQLATDQIRVVDELHDSGGRHVQTVNVADFDDMFGSHFPATVAFGSMPTVYTSLSADSKAPGPYEALFDRMKAQKLIR